MTSRLSERSIVDWQPPVAVADWPLKLRFTIGVGGGDVGGGMTTGGVGGSGGEGGEGGEL